MLIKNLDSVPPQPVNMEGAVSASVRVIFGPQDSAPTFAMRIFELAPSGHTPYHQHNFEHEVVILEGQIAVVTPEGPKTLAPRDALLVAPSELHQFRNLSASAPAKFMCLVPIAYQK